MSVYTSVSDSELKQFITQYDVGELVSYKGISAGIENTNYFVDTTQGRYVLTLFEHHSIDELSYFLDLMALLADSDVPTAKPIKQKSGEILSILKDKPASLVTRLEGSTLDKQETTYAQCEAIGDALAKMHLVSNKFPHIRQPDRGVAWRKMMGEKLANHQLLNDEDKQLLKQELAYQATVNFDKLPHGVIHADLFRDNAMFVDDDLSGIIDLYYACNDNFLFDMAVVVNDWCCRLDGGIDEKKLSIFLNAYHAVRPLTSIEKDLWYASLKAAALRFWLSRLQDKLEPREGELTQSKNPDEFKKKLQLLNASQETIESFWVDEFKQEKKVSNG